MLRLSEVTRQGSTTSYQEVTATRITGATEFVLANLPAVPSDGTAREYAATVLARSRAIETSRHEFAMPYVVVRSKSGVEGKAVFVEHNTFCFVVGSAGRARALAELSLVKRTRRV